MLFRSGAVIIIIRALVLASAAFAAHGRAAMTTERFALKQVFNVFAPICGGRMFMNRNKLLNFFKGVIINHAFAQAGNDFAFIAILADIGGINERTGKGITGKGQAARGFYAAPVQLVDDFLHGHAGGILLEHVTNMGRCFLVNNELAVYRLIAIGDRASAEEIGRASCRERV